MTMATQKDCITVATVLHNIIQAHKEAGHCSFYRAGYLDTSKSVYSDVVYIVPGLSSRPKHQPDRKVHKLGGVVVNDIAPKNIIPIARRDDVVIELFYNDEYQISTLPIEGGVLVNVMNHNTRNSKQVGDRRYITPPKATRTELHALSGTVNAQRVPESKCTNYFGTRIRT